MRYAYKNKRRGSLTRDARASLGYDHSNRPQKTHVRRRILPQQPRILPTMRKRKLRTRQLCLKPAKSIDIVTPKRLDNRRKKDNTKTILKVHI